MATCKKCLWYNEADDEQRMAGDDVVIVGEKETEKHYCANFTPIPPGVFETDKECEMFYND